MLGPVDRAKCKGKRLSSKNLFEWEFFRDHIAKVDGKIRTLKHLWK